MNLKMAFLAVVFSLGFNKAWAGANVYQCSQVGGKGLIEIRIQHPSMFSGKYVKLSDLRDSGHGPTYDYDATILNETPEGMPEGNYVLATTGVLGLILDQNMYSGSPQGTVAETVHSSVKPLRIYECQGE